MRVEWHGQSAFTLSGAGTTVFIDPFGDMAAARERGIAWDYPEIAAAGVDLLLVTHEHADHNAVERIDGEPLTLRSTAGTHSFAPLGEVVGIASEHDGVAGTERGPNTIFAFHLDGVRVAHLGDLGQPALRPEQRAALRASTCSSSRSAAASRSAARRRPRSPVTWTRPGSCRCTTGRRGSASSKPRRSSSRRWARRGGSTRPASISATWSEAPSRSS